MSDNGGMWNYLEWDAQFFHQYLNQHARMTQWIQNLHQNLPQPCHNCTNWEHHAYHHGHVPHQGELHHAAHHHATQHLQQYAPYQRQQHYAAHHHGQHHLQPIPQQRQQHHHGLQHGYHSSSFGDQENSRRNSFHNTHTRSRSQTSVEYISDNEKYVQEEQNVDYESEIELVFNADAILAFRATKAHQGVVDVHWVSYPFSEAIESTTELSLEQRVACTTSGNQILKVKFEETIEEEVKSEESFELIETILDENFEFVELDDAGQLQRMCGRPRAPDASGDVEYDREARIVIYGDRADRIAGLETSMEITFDHLNDLHRPVVYPHM